MIAHDATCFVNICADGLLGVDHRGLCTCGADENAEVDRQRWRGLHEDFVRSWNAKYIKEEVA